MHQQFKSDQVTQNDPSLSKQSIPLQLSSVSSNNANRSTSLSHSHSHSHSHAHAHKKYGNMIILFQNQRFLLTLGPDYWCFIIAMVLFSVLYYWTIKMVYVKGWNVLGSITAAGSALQILSYILVAISNPGIVTQADFDTEQSQQSNKVRRFCNICDQYMLPRSRHCSVCGVCVKGYDHHCPWTSKCIGRNNLKRFYFFASFTPLWIIFCIIMLGIVAA